MQTIVASKVFKPAPVHTIRERIELDDGDFIDINLSHKQGGEVVAIFHGLAGCIESSYVQGVFNTLERSGFCPVLMHWRGSSGEPNRLAHSYHSGASGDISWFVQYLSRRFSDQPIHAVGYSLGANALLKYLGESKSECPLKSAVAVCPPLVLAEGANKLDTGVARYYQRYLLGLLRAQHALKRRTYPALALPAINRKIDNFWKFDNAVTAPLNGFADVHDYYSKCSARQFIPRICVKTHILCARDDPFFTPEVIPGIDELPESVTLEVSRKGGHVGFLGHGVESAKNEKSASRRWLDTHVASILKNQRD